MPRTLLKYIFFRWLVPIGGAVLFYGGLLLANELVGISREVFNMGASYKWLLPLLLLAVPEVLMLVLPMGAVLGGLMGTQQLSQGSELVAAQGLGIGYRALVRPFLVLGALLVALGTLNTHFLVPAMNHLQAQVRSQMVDEARTRFLRSGQAPRFPPGSSGQALWMDPNGQVHVVDIRPNAVQHMVANGISYSLRPQEDGSHLMDLQLRNLDGALFQTQSHTVVNLHQERQDLRFRLPGNAKLLPSTPLRYLSTAEVLHTASPAADVELGRRFALPIASAAMLLMGIALGLGHPRFQSGGSFLKSLAVVIAYYFLNMLLENNILQSNPKAFVGVLVLPFGFLAMGLVWLRAKLRPHQSNRVLFRAAFRVRRFCSNRIQALNSAFSALKFHFQGQPSVESSVGSQRSILLRWSTSTWIQGWGAALGALVALDLLIEYASLATDLVKNHHGIGIFLKYWILNLPSFLAVALPICFLLGTLLAMGKAAQTSEWVALRAGGLSLAQWIWKARFAWIGVLACTAFLQIWAAPYAFTKADSLYRKILDRPSQAVGGNNWLYLGTTGVLWNQQGEVRWGFPLKPPREAPILLRWKAGDAHSTGLAWGGTRLVSGPAAATLFPEASLREEVHSDMTGTMDLIRWQRWAPDPNRATLLWYRLLSWLAGPCLVMAMLSWSFPTPRSGRGQSLGKGLVAGLLFLGLQGVFLGAAKSGEIPAPLAVLAPMLLFSGFGLHRLRHLRT